MGSREERSEGPAALGALCCHLPGSPGGSSGRWALHFPSGQEGLGFCTQPHSLPFPWVCPGKMRLCPTPLEYGPSVLPPRQGEERSGSVCQASSPGCAGSVTVLQGTRGSRPWLAPGGTCRGGTVVSPNWVLDILQVPSNYNRVVETSVQIPDLPFFSCVTLTSYLTRPNLSFKEQVPLLPPPCEIYHMRIS